MSDRKYTSIHRKDAAGRIEFKGGKAVWQWSQDANDSTSILIKSLDNPEIELEKTQRAPIVQPPTDRETRPRRSAVSDSASSAARGAATEDDRQNLDDTLRQLRAARENSFDPYNRS